jgi:hypothetical protein
MNRSLTGVATELEALTLLDFDPMNVDAAGADRLQAICAELVQRNDPEQWAPLLYALMERLDDADMGSPGPIVHALEAWSGYPPILAESLHRKPTPLTVWMVNRLLNTDPSDASHWLELLRRTAEHSAASPKARADAQDFLEHQAGRR